MFPFVETIRTENGKAENLDFHEARFLNTYKHFYKHFPSFSIKKIAEEMVIPNELMKLRITYGEELGDVSSTPYTLRNVSNLQIVRKDINYDYKLTDRSPLDEAFSMRGRADDVLIVRHGLVTDTSIGNVAFWDGTVWKTPKTPLLKGTRCESLLLGKKISATDISEADIFSYYKISIFNAMIPFGTVVFAISKNETVFEP